MATIALRYHLSKSVYTVNLNNENVPTIVTVTATPSIVKEWLYSTLQDYAMYRHRLIVGLGVQCTPDGTDNPPPHTLQLCVGSLCLIFQLSLADTVPEFLRTFLLHRTNRFVGFFNQSHRKKLEDSKHRLKMHMDPFDLGTCCTDPADTDQIKSVSGIAKLCLGIEVEHKDEIKFSDWSGQIRLSQEQILFACIEAQCAFLIAKRNKVWKKIADS
ncbi:hypothetical protein RIF29_41110 [Crotalaria pallida]|uniref:3'-5' exonuclease n=1 Tax=Crotalaria pallida TaxID=3830 RepID=A0AAN9E7E0_CROPI